MSSCRSSGSRCHRIATNEFENPPVPLKETQRWYVKKWSSYGSKESRTSKTHAVCVRNATPYGSHHFIDACASLAFDVVSSSTFDDDDDECGSGAGSSVFPPDATPRDAGNSREHRDVAAVASERPRRMNCALFIPIGGVRACVGSRPGTVMCSSSLTRCALRCTESTLRESCSSLSSPDE